MHLHVDASWLSHLTCAQTEAQQRSALHFLCNAAWPVSSFLFVGIMCSFLLSLSSCTSWSKGQSVHRTGLMISLLKTNISSEDFSISALRPKHRRQTSVTDWRWFALKTSHSYIWRSAHWGLVCVDLKPTSALPCLSGCCFHWRILQNVFSAQRRLQPLIRFQVVCSSYESFRVKYDFLNRESGLLSDDNIV